MVHSIRSSRTYFVSGETVISMGSSASSVVTCFNISMAPALVLSSGIRHSYFIVFIIHLSMACYLRDGKTMIRTLVYLQLDAQNSYLYIYIIHLLKSSTCFEHYSAHLQEFYVIIVYMQPLVSSLCRWLSCAPFNRCWSWSGRPARLRPTTLLPPRSKVKPEAVNALVSS
jgi:hypothetical protein